MTTLHRAYTSTEDAENAIERLLSAGVPAIRIELITGRAVKDARDTPIGTFAGTTTADAQTVGSYADIAHSGREAIGAALSTAFSQSTAPRLVESTTLGRAVVRRAIGLSLAAHARAISLWAPRPMTISPTCPIISRLAWWRTLP